MSVSSPDDLLNRYVGVFVRVTFMFGKSTLILDTVIDRITRQGEGGIITLDGGVFFAERAEIVDVTPKMLILRDLDRKWSMTAIRWDDMPEEFEPYPRVETG